MKATDLSDKPVKRIPKRRLSKWESLQKDALASEFTTNERNISKTSKTLGISRNAVLRKLKRYGLKEEQKLP
jgi:transcriptional regulator of acetoin/glycerol metabolism